LQLATITLSRENLLEVFRRTLIADCSLYTGDAACELRREDPECQYNIWKRVFLRSAAGEMDGDGSTELEIDSADACNL
jgi:hypothetical protein